MNFASTMYDRKVWIRIEKYLPNGSVILLNDASKRLLIYGRKQRLIEGTDSEGEQVNDVMFDYIGVPYPEGYIDQEYTYVFNHSDIAEVVFTGYTDEEEDAFQEMLSEN